MSDWLRHNKHSRHNSSVHGFHSFTVNISEGRPVVRLSNLTMLIRKMVLTGITHMEENSIQAGHLIIGREHA